MAWLWGVVMIETVALTRAPTRHVSKISFVLISQMKKSEAWLVHRSRRWCQRLLNENQSEAINVHKLK